MQLIKRICAALAVTLSLCSYQVHAASEDIEKLDRAWDEVYKSIGWLTQYFRDLTADGDATERFDGYKGLMNVLTDNYLNSIYYDRDRPEYLPYLRPEFSNFCAPNTDFKYGMVHVEPGASYRVWGTRGNAEVIDIQQYTIWPGQQDSPIRSTLGKYAQGTFDSRGIKVDKHGNFEFTIGPTKPAKGQWWQTESDGVLLMVRDIFLDHTTEAKPARFYFEKLGPKKAGPTTLSASEAADRLYAFARSLKHWDVCFKFPDIEENNFVVKDWYAKPEAKDKKFFDKSDAAKDIAADAKIELSPGQLKPPPGQTKVTAAQLTQTYHMAYYNLKPDEALIGEWTPPKKSLNWSVQLYTRLLQNLGFIDRQTDINTAAAHLDSDGVMRFVISHKDPGVANWLDVDGRPLGTVIVRCKLCSERGEVPKLKLVAVSDVMKYLPKDTKMVTPKERDQLLEKRRMHYLTRYHQ